VAKAGGRRITDYLGLTRPRDAAPYTWRFAFGSGLGFGIVIGVAIGLTTPGRGFSWEALFISIAAGVVLYAPLSRWVSHTESQSCEGPLIDAIATTQDRPSTRQSSAFACSPPPPSGVADEWN
jgi:hypothetical protein